MPDRVVWSGGQQGSGCTVAEVFVGASDGDCWFDDPYFKTAFADVCIPSECFCDAVEIYSSLQNYCFNPITRTGTRVRKFMMMNFLGPGLHGVLCSRGGYGVE